MLTNLDLLAYGYSILYAIFYKQLRNVYDREISARTISVMHAILMLCITFISIIENEYNYYGYFICLMCVQYWICDIIVGGKRMTRDIVTHHIISSLFVLYFIYWNQYTEYIQMAMIVEMPTLFLHIRWFLLEFGQKKTSIYLINGFLLWITFLVCRVLYFIYFIYYILYKIDDYEFDIHRIIFLSGIVSIWIMSLFWFYKLTMAIKKVLDKKKKKKQI